MRHIIFSVALLLGLVGCGAEDVQKRTDTEAPEVQFAPRAKSAIPINASLTLTFSAAMDQQTLNAQNILLYDAANQGVPLDLTTDARSVVITPRQPLSPESSYLLTVTTGAADQLGRTLSHDYSWAFTTAAKADAIAPTLLSVLPLSGSAGVDPATAVGVQFSEPMLIRAEESYLELLDAAQQPVAATTKNGSDTLRLIPSATLQPQKSYTLRLTQTLYDLSGNPYEGSQSWTFTTASATLDGSGFKELAAHALSGRYYALAVDNGTLLAAGSNTLALLAYDNGAFSPAGTLTLQTTVYDIALDTASKNAYLAAESGLLVVDYSDAAAPNLIGTLATSVPAYGVTRTQNGVLLSASSAGVLHIDVSNPASPQLLESYAPQSSAFDACDESSGVLFADYSGGVMRHDGQNATAVIASDAFAARSLACDALTLYAAGGIAGIRSIDRQNDTAMSAPTLAYAMQSVAPADTGLLFVADNEKGVAVFTVESNALVHRSQLAPGGQVYAVDADDATLFLLTRDGSVRAYNLSPDDTPPQLLSTDPEDNASLDSAYAGPATFVFSEAIASGTLDSTTVMLERWDEETTAWQSITTELASNGAQVTLTPQSTLADGRYRITLGAALSDLYGNTLGTAYNYEFTVGTLAAVAGTVVINPVASDNVISGAEAESTSMNISGTASGGDISGGDTLTLTLGGTAYTTTVLSSGSWSVAVPTNDLVSALGFTVEVVSTNAYGASVTSSAASNYSVDLTADAGTVSVNSITADDIINITEAAASITVTGTATGGDISAGDAVSMIINGSNYPTSVGSGGSWSVAVPGASLAADTSFTVNVTSYDSVGNSVVSSGNSSHSVDTIRPYYNSSVPADGNNTVGDFTGFYNGDITVQMSEGLDSASVTTATVRLWSTVSVPTLVSTTVTLESYNTLIRINPAATLTQGSYQVEITTGVKDRAGNAMSATKTINFTVPGV